jgi:hypothetical protein
MDRRSGRTVFWLGFMVYAVSFFLSFLGGRGDYTPKPLSGADCAIVWFFFSWTYVHLHGMGSFSGKMRRLKTCRLPSGWINPVFFLGVLFQVIGKTPQLTRILRNVILLMLPFCWIVFLDWHVHSREGYFLWTGGMLLVLFSSELESGDPRWNRWRPEF